MTTRWSAGSRPGRSAGSIGVRDEVTLVLHDWGGMIGMAYAHRQPERVKRLVVLNTAAFHLPAGEAAALVAVAVPQHR